MVANRSSLSAREVHERLRAALSELRRAERNAVLWFAEVVRRKLYRELGYSSVHQYAELALGFKKSKTSQFLRLSESLKELPELRRSVARGELSWTKAREVAKVATPKTEAAWIREAKKSPRRALESRVAETRKRAREGRGPSRAQAVLNMPAPSDDKAKETCPSPAPGTADVPMDVHVRMTSEQYARYQALMEALRKQRHSGPQAELLLAGLEQLVLAGDAGRQGAAGRSGSGSAGDPGRGEFTRVNSRSPYQVIVQQCPDCGAGRVATSRGDRRLAPQELRAILCDAHKRMPEKKNRAAVPERLRRAVLQRDRFRCRSAGCGGTSFLAVHHLVPRELGGANAPENLITLCSSCHRTLHARERALHARERTLHSRE